MYRVATLGLFALVSASPVFAFEAPKDPVALPSAVANAVIRPSMDATEHLIQEASLTPPDADVAPAQPSLAARLAMAPKLIVKVDLSDQTMKVVVEGETRYTWAVSTAGKGYRTPVGVWQPYRMHTMWRSRKYDNAPMPHSIFFTGGYAIHATPYVRKLGRPASHGCVRLHPDNAKELFALAKQYGRASMRVVVER